MKKIQVSLPGPLAKEIDAYAKENGFESESECGRHIIQEYMTLRKYGIVKDTLTPRLGGEPRIEESFASALREQFAEA